MRLLPDDDARCFQIGKEESALAAPSSASSKEEDKKRAEEERERNESARQEEEKEEDAEERSERIETRPAPFEISVERKSSNLSNVFVSLGFQ